nr:PREDICTED: histone deacetylase 19-like [Daucus carota subsp. sativus]
MPQHEYYEYFGPDYTLHVAPSNMENKNSRQILDDIKAKLLDNLSKLQHAPSVPFQERPPDTEFPEADEDQDEDGRWGRESEMDVDDQRKPFSGRVKMEIFEPEQKEAVDAREGEHARGMDATFTETASLKASNPISISMDGMHINSEQGNASKQSDGPADMDP